MIDLGVPRVKSNARILIVEDDPDAARFFADLIKSEGYDLRVCHSGEEAMEVLEEQPGYDLVLLDLILPSMSGWDLLCHIKADGRLRYVPVVVLSALNDKHNALRALELGAEDYLTKPVDIDAMLSRVRVMLRIRTLYEDLLYERVGRQKAVRTMEMRRYLAEVMGGSTKVRELADVLERVVTTETTVLLEGESGTGKGLLAEVVHRFSPRSEGPFVVVNCSAYPEGLLSSELFGHEKGSFTGAIRRKSGRFELAAGGTIFLDEVAEISPLTQLSLLRVIQDRKFERVGGEKTLTADVRIVAATNKRMKDMVDRGLFREDLYYRLNVVSLEVPALRERLEDIPFLANYFLRRECEKLSKVIYGFTRKCLGRLVDYSWPGNVRELRNAIEHAALMSKKEALGVEDLPGDLLRAEFEPLPGGELGSGRFADQERRIVEQALARSGWNKYQAAKTLGIARSTLYSKIKRLGISPPDNGQA